MGHGLFVAIGQIVAEELDVPFKAVKVYMGDTANSVNQGGASGSTGIQLGGKQMRVAAAEARRVLVDMAAERLGVPPDDLVEGIEKRSVELKSLRDEVKGLRRQVAAASAGSLLDDAVDGVVVARVEAETRDEVRDLAMSLRDRPGVRAVVLGASPGGKGVALVAAVQPGCGLNAGELISEAVKVVGGGGGKGADLASAGGKDPSRLDEALDLVRSELGVPAA